MASGLETSVHIEKISNGWCHGCGSWHACVRIKFGKIRYERKGIELCESCYADLKLAVADDGNKKILLCQEAKRPNKTGIRHYKIQRQKGYAGKIYYMHQVKIRLDSVNYVLYSKSSKNDELLPEAIEIAKKLNEMVVIYRYNGSKEPLMKFIKENSK